MKNNKKKDGFLLVEVVIAIALFSSIITVLGTAFFQITKSLQSIVRLHFFDTRIFTLQNLFEKEIAGIYIPSLVALSSKGESGQTSIVTSQKKTEGEWPEKAFFVEHYGDGNLKEMRFITSNSVSVYNTAKPYCVLVIYELVKNTVTNTFLLQRTESTIFDVKGSIKKTGPFVVVEGIKSLSVKMYGEKKPQEKESKEDDKEKKTDKKRKEFEEKVEWNSDDYKKKDEEAQKQVQKQDDDESSLIKPLPTYIAFSLVLQDALSDKTCPVEFICAPLYGIEKVVIPVKNNSDQNDEAQKKNHNDQEQKKESSDDQVHNNEPPSVAGIEKIQQTPLSSSLQSKVDGYKVNKNQQGASQ